MNESILTWNVANFITVSLMVMLGVALYYFAGKAYRTRGAK